MPDSPHAARRTARAPVATGAGAASRASVEYDENPGLQEQLDDCLAETNILRDQLAAEKQRADDEKARADACEQGLDGTLTRPTFDDLLGCATDAYTSSYESMSFIAAGGIDAFGAVRRQMRLGPLTTGDCDPNNPFTLVLFADHLGIVRAVEGVAGDLEGLLFDRRTGWPKVIAQLFDEVKAYSDALCHCEDAVWAEAELRAALIDTREWLVADWTAEALAGSVVLARMFDGVEAVIGKLDTCPPIGASGSLVETTALWAGATPSQARAVDQYFLRTTAAIEPTIDAILSDSPTVTELRDLVVTYAQLAAFPVPLKFPLVGRDRGSRELRAISDGHAHLSSTYGIDKTENLTNKARLTDSVGHEWKGKMARGDRAMVTRMRG